MLHPQPVLRNSLQCIMKIDGRQITDEILQNLQERVTKLKEKKVTPHIYIVTFGDNPQTESYLKQKILRTNQIGAKITIKRFSINVSTKRVHDFIEKLNKDKKVHGIIVQRPLNKNLDEEKISLSVIKEKDIDGFHPSSLFSVPVAIAVIKLIDSTLPDEDIYEYLKSKKIALIGKGITAGLPIINLFVKLGIKPLIITSKTKNIQNLLKSADIIVSSVGKKIITKDNIKKGVVLIGVGMHTENGKLKGDFEESEIQAKASFYAPTPGGVGPVNVAMLMKNLVEATETQTN